MRRSEPLRDQVALITGASSGIGEALARELARQGCHLMLAARRTDRLERLAQELTRPGLTVTALTCDVTRDGDLERAVSRAVEMHSRLDWVVANAGFGVLASAARLTLDDFRRQYETNVYGVVRTLLAAREPLVRARGRAIVVGSVMGSVPLPGGEPYASSKAAVHSIARSLGLELSADGVSVTLVAPGFVQSEIRSGLGEDPVPRWIQMPAKTAARQIVRAARRRKPEVVITWHGKIGIWLYRFVPWLVRFAMKKRRSPR